MPIYTYSCDQCKNRFEIKALLEQKNTEDPEIFKCPRCGSSAITRQLTNVGILSSAKSNNHKQICPTGTCPFVS